MKILHTPLTHHDICSLRSGDEVFLTGEIYTARDQAHQKLADLIQKKKKLPVSLNEVTFFYCGPTPPPPGEVIGSCGPTTASRMDSFTPLLMKHGLRSMIGKGSRNERVREALQKYCGVYFVTHGGCGAYLQERVQQKSCIAFPELGPEAIYKLTVQNFPLIVALDTRGHSIFK